MSNSGIKTYWKNTLSFTLILALIATGGFGFFWSQMIYGVRASDKSKLTNENICVNALILGVDKEGYRTDVIIFAQLNLANNSLNMIQIPRDTYVASNKLDHKINSSYISFKNGKLVPKVENVYTSVEEVLGLKADNYILVDIKGFRSIIDAIGGVEFDVPIRMKYDDPDQDLYIDLQKGKQILDGKKAEMLVRFRKNNDGSGYPGADLDRNKVQRKFIYAVIDKVFDITNFSKLPELVASVASSVKTSFDSNKILQYATIALSVPRENINIMGIEGVAENRSYGSYFVANKALNKELVNKYFIDGENSSVDGVEVSRRNLLMSDDSDKTEKVDMTRADASFIEKKLANVEIIDGSCGKKDVSSIKSALESKGYRVKDIHSTGSVEYNETKIIAKKASANVNTICKILGEEKYVVNPSKTDTADILIVIGA
ncbi:MAG: LCP family protein [Oscillospiraceae bacterium]|nr:LCP family protein [Oscillospiraceae bacterium]